MNRHTCMAVLFLICCAFQFYTDFDILSYYFNHNARIKESRNNVKIEEIIMQHHKKNKEEIDANNKFDEHKSDLVEVIVALSVDDFDDFTFKVLKYKDLFEQIHLESINLFEGMTSLKLFPSCIPQHQYTNGQICLKKTEIHNLENLKLIAIELGINIIGFGKTFNHTLIIKKFDNLFISGTIDNENSNDQDKYNKSIRNGEFITWHHDDFNPSFFNLKISFDESFSGKNVNSKPDLKYIKDMKFNLPVQGFDGLLKLLENEIHIPTTLLPSKMNYDCMITYNYETVHRIIHFKTHNTILLEQHKYNVTNLVNFFKNGDSYQMGFHVYFKELFWTANFTIKIDEQLNLVDFAIFNLKGLEINITYISNNVPAYNVHISDKYPIYISSTEKMMPYFDGVHNLKKHVQFCISQKIKRSLESSLNPTDIGIILEMMKYVRI